MLQSVAQVRNWVVEHVPLADTLLGYDLFLKLGNDIIAGGQPLDVDQLAASLPYEPHQVRGHLELMAQAGLLVLAESAPGRHVVHPTPRFMALLEKYSRKFESLFIVREDLRSQQLLSAVSDPELAAFGKMLYDRAYDLGWLYLYNFGSVCFLIASLVRRIAVAHGRQARVAPAYIEIAGPESRYMLGAQGYVQPGQVEGHAVCVVDEKMIVDFGLGNARKGYRRDFHWGALCDYRPAGAVMGAAAVPGRETMTWMDDWKTPHLETEVARYAPHIEGLFAEYAARFSG
jgi:hypothetical protein